MLRKLFSVSVIVMGLIGIATTGQAASSFFEGKTIRIIVGLSAGGGYDMWARAIGRHLGQNVPGHPSVIVDNMPGAGSMIAGNYMYERAKPDGLTIGHVSGGIVMNQILGRPGAQFDARKFEYLGAPYQDDMVAFIRKGRGITNIKQWRSAKEPVKFGGQAPGATFSDNMPRILRAALGLPIKPVTGYKGTAEVKLAIATGEVDGNCLSWESGKATWRKQLETGEIIPIIQGTAEPIPEIPNVAMAIRLAKTDKARRLIVAGLQEPSVYARPFFLPPGTPADRVETLRDAFAATMKDPAFLADLKKARLNPKPATAAELTKVINDLFNMDQSMKDELKGLLYQ